MAITAVRFVMVPFTLLVILLQVVITWESWSMIVLDQLYVCELDQRTDIEMLNIDTGMKVQVVDVATRGPVVCLTASS